MVTVLHWSIYNASKWFHHTDFPLERLFTVCGDFGYQLLHHGQVQDFLFCYLLVNSGGSVIKNSHTKQEVQVQSLSWEGPLEKGMATHTSILAWEIPWTEEPGRLRFMESQRVGHNSVNQKQQSKYLSVQP